MYWSVETSGDIRRANLDGSGQEILVRNLDRPAGIALDLASGKMYWIDFGGGNIRRANLDGTGQQTLITGLTGPTVITLDLSVPPPLKIRTATKADSYFTLNWNALLGRAYQVQFKSDLIQSNWANLGSRLTATNATMGTLDSVTSDPQRLYRIFLLP